MSILINSSTKIVVSGSFTPMVLNQCREMLERGVKLSGVVGANWPHTSTDFNLIESFDHAAKSSSAQVAVFFDETLGRSRAPKK